MPPRGFAVSIGGHAGTAAPARAPHERGPLSVSGPGWDVTVLPPLLTPSGVEQPLMTPEAVLVYEGRIDNRTEIARLTGLASLAPEDDGLVILAAYRKWGEACSARLIGEFCFAIGNRRTHTVFAANDALGIRPLLTFQDGSRYIIASSIEAIFAVTAPPALDIDGLAAFMATGGFIGPTRRTVFRGIEYAAGGTAISVSGTGVRTRRPWAPDLSADASNLDLDEAFRALLFEGVGASLRGGGVIATELSGGLDSSSVTCAAFALRDAGAVVNLLAYSFYGSKTTSADERSFQRLVRDRFVVEHHEYDIDALDGTPDLRGCAQPHGVAFQSWGLAAQRHLARTRGVRSCLTGQGGDAVFCLARPEAPGPVRRVLQHMFGARGTLAPRAPGWLTPPVRRQVAAITAALTAPGRRGEEHLGTIARFAAILPPPHLAPWEARYPLLYRPLVEFMLRLPWHEKATSGDNRIIQRRALDGVVLPPAIARRGTKGDFTPRIFSELRDRWDFWEPLSRGERIGELGLVEPAVFHEACVRLRHGLAEADLSFFNGALLLEAWLRDGAPSTRT